MADIPLWVPIAAAVGAACVGAGAAIVGVLVKGRIDRHHRIESESKEQRFALYKRLSDILRTSESLGPKNADLLVDIGLFASDDVVRAWTGYVDALFAGVVGGKNSAANVRLVGEILLAMRRDASRPDSALTGEDVMAAMGVRSWRVEDAKGDGTGK